VNSLALSKERKNELVAQYEGWLKEGEAVVLTEYTGLDMPSIDKLRQQVRDAGGEFHVIKNTLARIAFDAAGRQVPDEYFAGSTAIAIAFDDPPGVTKVLVDFGKQAEAIKLKGGYLGAQHMTAEELTALAELPPLPVVRSQLLGVLMEPASRLARLLNEPGRQLAQVIKAYSDRGEAAPEAA
jgi:large subunit ribosomal protein L10